MRARLVVPRVLAAGVTGLLAAGCGPQAPGEGAGTVSEQVPAVDSPVATYWNSATIYFLLTDRFLNGDPSNDTALGRPKDGAPLRSFLGGDFAGVLLKLQEGYFDSLGVNALWMTPFVEQIRGSVDEGTGKTYGFHGYWTRDWTAVDPAFGTEEELRSLVAEAHRRGIRLLMDAVINHTGPVTPQDPAWPDDWVRTGPRCAFRDYASTVDCTLVDNLPDILTERDEPVDLPEPLLEKWRREGRLDDELAELDAFFQRTGYPRAPRYYVMKWLTDWVREVGFDGYRVDTAKHFPERLSAELKQEATHAFAEWKEANPDEVLDDLPFFFLGEVYNYDLAHGRDFDFGDRTVDFFDHGYDALVNFGFKRHAAGPAEEMFARYSRELRQGELAGFSVLNYVSSHDDGEPLDLHREDPIGAGTRLLLAPGGAQIYYGDEIARPLSVDGAQGDANLRSMMPWNVAEGGADAEAGTAEAVLAHWRRLGRFRRNHPAVGAGEHALLRADPYVFARMLRTATTTDHVVVALDHPPGAKTIPVAGVFADGTHLRDAYSGLTGIVSDGAVSFDTPSGVVLLEEASR